MFLMHETTKNYYMDIFKSKHLVPASKTTNSNKNPYDEHLPYVYLNFYNKPTRYKYLFPYTFVFPVDLLYDMSFYISWAYVAGDLERSVYYKKNTPPKVINKVLETVLENSQTVAKGMQNLRHKKYSYPTFTLFQEIFFRKHIPIDKATHFIIPSNGIPLEDIEYIQLNYPNLKLIRSEFNDAWWTDEEYMTFITDTVKWGYEYQYELYARQRITASGKELV